MCDDAATYFWGNKKRGTQSADRGVKMRLYGEWTLDGWRQVERSKSGGFSEIGAT